MRQRSIYLSDDVWRLVKIEAASRGITSSQVVTNALEAHLQPKPAPTITVPDGNVIRTPDDADAVFGQLERLAHRAFTPVPKPTTSKRKAR